MEGNEEVRRETYRHDGGISELVKVLCQDKTVTDGIIFRISKDIDLMCTFQCIPGIQALCVYIL